MLFRLAGNEGFRCSCLDFFINSCCCRSARFASLVIGALVPPTARVLRESLAVCTDLGTRICRKSALRFLPLRGSQRRESKKPINLSDRKIFFFKTPPPFPLHTPSTTNPPSCPLPPSPHPVQHQFPLPSSTSSTRPLPPLQCA